MGSTFEVSRAEFGFLVAGPSEGLQVKTPFHRVQVPGLPVDQVQYCRPTVAQRPNESREHIVVMSQFPLLSAETCGNIAGFSYPGVALTFIRSDSAARCEATSDSDPSEVAAAVAEAKRAGTLDDIDQVRVVVGHRTFDVGVRWVTNRAEADVSEVAG